MDEWAPRQMGGCIPGSRFAGRGRRSRSAPDGRRAGQWADFPRPLSCPCARCTTWPWRWPLLDGRGHLHHGATMAAELMGPSIIAAIEVQCIPPVSPSVLLVIVT